jgi:dihydroxy-acid dehydratase
VDSGELAQRRAAWRPPPPRFGRGYGALFSEQVTQANEGCDFEFLARSGAAADPEPNPQ